MVAALVRHARTNEHGCSESPERSAPTLTTFARDSALNPPSVMRRWPTTIDLGESVVDIRSIPTVMAFREGVLVYSQPGAMPPTVLASSHRSKRST